jgi:UDP-N-acetylglucosamine pyrophosphorylase
MRTVSPAAFMFLAFFRVINVVTISEWDRIKSPDDKHVIPYDYLPQISSADALSKLAVLKVNGGLGTSMGTIIYFPLHLSLRTCKG